MADGYTVAFNALKKLNLHSRPFQTCTHIEIQDATVIKSGGRFNVVLYFEDLLTGEKNTEKVKMTLGQKRVICNPFHQFLGPYFLNPVEGAVKKFRKD